YFLIVNQIKKNNFFEMIIVITILYFLLGVPINQARLNFAFRGEASTFATKWEEREIKIHEQLISGQFALIVPMIPENIVDIEPIQTNPGHWINVCAAEYYGVDQISAE
ncbi:MAG TPA: hypothetical protein VK856_13115, partial [Anaerolineaceae bacterium]|nr:hypothetical protein [Anaerolineaceae bacterium]